jgi:hypothetical protein
MRNQDASEECLFVTKREIDQAKRRGDRLELMSHERYCAEVSDRMIVRCPHA